MDNNREIETVDCCIVGVVLGQLLARQGVSMLLLEAHQNFDRDFRGTPFTRLPSSCRADWPAGQAREA